MPIRQTLDAVVLRTIDIGEADRFCILLTSERGRIAARARAVRKTSSRMGGSLLPMQRLLVDISEHGSGLLITGVSQPKNQSTSHQTFHAFVTHAQGIDLLLACTEDDEPILPVFDLVCCFISCSPDALPGLLPAFQARLLHLLGFMPARAEDSRIQNFPEAVQGFLEAVLSPLPLDALALLTPDDPELTHFLEGLIDEHSARPMRSRMMAAHSMDGEKRVFPTL